MMIKITFYCSLVRELQLQNVDIIVADISTFEMEATYDRIFSIEMFEVRFLWATNLRVDCSNHVLLSFRVDFDRDTAYEEL